MKALKTRSCDFGFADSKSNWVGGARVGGTNSDCDCPSPPAPLPIRARGARGSMLAVALLLLPILSDAVLRAADPVKPKTFSRVQIKDAAGKDVWEFKGKDDGAKVVDAQEHELFRINLSDHKLKIKKPDDTVVGYVSAKPGEFKVIDATGKKELFEVQRQADGDWKLKNGRDELVVRIKKRDYGFELESQDEKSLFKSKLKDGKASLRDARDQTVYYSKDTASTLAVSCLGMKAISDDGMRLGLVAAVMWFEAESERKTP